MEIFKKNLFKNKLILTSILSLFIFIIIFSLPKFFIILDKKISYYFLKNQNKNFEVSKEIVVVNIDDLSISKIWSFPFSREVYSTLVKNLDEKKAWVIAFDIILSDNWPDKKVDDNLSSSIFESKKVVLWSAIVDNWLESIIPPLNKFLTWSTKYWFFTPNIHKISWESYSFSPIKRLNITEKLEDLRVRNSKKDFNHFSVEILKKYFSRENIKYYKNSIEIIPWEKIPYSNAKNKEILINYLPNKKFKKQISLSDIYFKEWRFESFDFENKIILLWATAKGLKDIFNTPNWADFWVYVHANILNTILSGKFLVLFNEKLEWALLILIIILAVYFNLSNNNKLVVISNLVLFFSYIALFNILLSLQVWIMLNYPAYTIFAFIMAITISNIAKYLTENKDKKRMLGALSEYISKDIASEILNSSWNVNLSGERKNISIFFSDIEGFTTISEKMNPEELVEFLREYLWAMSNIIMDERWFIDKYEWDAIMALWWVFGHENKSNYDNCISALKQQKALEKLNVAWEKIFGQKLNIRMWLNFWEAIVWNIWAKGRKMEFTALWDSVNLASRLESINKKYGTSICVSQSVYNNQKDNFEFRYLDKIRVKGKEIATDIYELVWEKSLVSDFKMDIARRFKEAIWFYLKRDFGKAKDIFQDLSNLWDKPSSVYLDRCIMYTKTPPPENWDGVWNMDSK